MYLQVVHLQQEIVLTVSKQKFEKKPSFMTSCITKYNNISIVETVITIVHFHRVGVMVFSATFNNISVIQCGKPFFKVTRQSG